MAYAPRGDLDLYLPGIDRLGMGGVDLTQKRNTDRRD
jgi:hypothetical protein